MPMPTNLASRKSLAVDIKGRRIERTVSSSSVFFFSFFFFFLFFFIIIFFFCCCCFFFCFCFCFFCLFFHPLIVSRSTQSRRSKALNRIMFLSVRSASLLILAA